MRNVYTQRFSPVSLSTLGECSVYVLSMGMIRVDAKELEQAIHIWLKIIAQRQPSLLRDLWSRRGDEYDREKLEKTRAEFARTLTQRFLTAKWDVLREETMHDTIWRENDEKQLPLPRL